MTYYSARGPKAQIQCFTEKVEKDAGLNRHISTTSYEIVDSSSPVVFLDTVQIRRNEQNVPTTALVIVHKDGSLRCLSEDLSEEYWRHQPTSADPSNDQRINSVVHATIIDVEQARRGLLKNREDILAVLQDGSIVGASKSPDPSILVLVNRSFTGDVGKGDYQIELKLVKISGSQVASTNGMKRRRISAAGELATFAVPQPANLMGRKSVFHFHKSSGHLYHHLGQYLAIYNFAGPNPRLEQHIHLSSKIRSCVRLSSTAVFINSASTVSILDTHFKTIQASCNTDPGPEIPRNPENTDAVAEKPEHLRLLSYCSPLKLLVGLLGRSLITFLVDDATAGANGSRETSRSGLLIDGVGKGIRSATLAGRSNNSGTSSIKSFGKYLLLDSREKAWDTTKAQLDTLVKLNDTSGFDHAMQVALDVSSNLDKDGPQEDRGEECESTMDTTKGGRIEIQYVLSKMFGLRGEDGTQIALPLLKVDFLPERTFEWLLAKRHFSQHQVESALKHTGQLQAPAQLPPGAVVTALVSFDKSLGTLNKVAQSSSYLAPGEIISCIRIATDTLLESASSHDTKLLTNGEIRSSPQHISVMQVELAEQDTTKDMNKPNRIADSMTTANAILRACLSRLYHCHEIDIRKALRGELSQQYLLSFVDHIRMGLARSGWLSRYVDEALFPIEDHSERIDNMKVAAKLMNCAIDSLGSGGWISGSSSNIDLAESGDTIAYMKAEISAALEGIEEAAYLDGVLKEVLLYSKTAKHLGSLHKGNQHPNMVKPITIPSEEIARNALPIGLNAEQGVGLTQVVAGGELKARSARNIGRLKSRKVGLYSFERIMV